MATASTDKSLIRSLKTQLAEKSAEAERIASTFKEENGAFVVSPEQRNSYVKAVRDAQEIKGLLDAAQGAENLNGYLDAPDGSSTAGQHYGRSTPGGPEVKSLGDLFVESDAYQRAAAADFKDRPFIRAEMEGKSIFSLSAGTHTHQALGGVQDLGITEAQRRKWHIRDLFPAAKTKNAVLLGIRETGWVNNAAQVAERRAADGVSAPTGTDTDVFGRAPRSKLKLEPVAFPIAEIAHMIDGHKNILSDEPRLKQFINSRLIEGIKFAEDVDLLHSVGTDGTSLTGLFNTPGVQTYTGQSSDKYSIQMRRAMTKALLAEYEPTGVVISPTMWEQVEVETDDTGAFRVALQVAVGAQKKVWKLNVVETTAMPDGKYLLGSFGMGAQLYDRENVSVTVSSENSDNFERGVLTFRADERLALEVSRPESFVIGTWTTPAG
ncbi:phage major capsid protein [Streptomyces tirandamycinicus]|uniref:Phage major capsid protein n=1 Tax=Streptomyces tirandamycinicus TaxID=2174846 RepID=A0A2S1T222_9ACTN|nr:phage major capsid protein [Streptomyces tirandamycinicus]AWI32700.1 phage major capsid protein [Streptomyces tirandamycinicus]